MAPETGQAGMILDRYIARVVITGVAVSALVFSGLFFFIDLVRELKTVGTADYTTWHAFAFVVLHVPQRMYELAPSVILVGSLISLGAMAASSEIVILRASGMSTMRIVRSVLQVGVILALLVALMGELLVPRSIALAQSIRLQAMQKEVITGGKTGFWSRDENRYINIKRILPDRKLDGVDIFEFDEDDRLLSSMSAVSAEKQPGGWTLYQVRETRFDGAGLASRQLDEFFTDKLVRAELFDVLESAPEDMSAKELYQYNSYLEQNELDAGLYQLQFWIRMFTPMTCLVMILVALPLVFSAQVRSGGLGQRVFAGLSIGIVFFVFNRMVNHVGLVYGVSPALSAAIPPLTVAFIMVMLLRKV